MDNTIDILEDNIVKYGYSLLDILLQDKTTKRNIIWATTDYERFGEEYKAYKEITPELITGMFDNIIQPRITKAREHQDNRTRDKAEVFTPAWVCNEQNNMVDEKWFGRSNIFNLSNGNEWITVSDKVVFSNIKGKTWKDYVDARRLEVTCGEAPYLVSRYDAVMGTVIPIQKRIGILDRKLRIVNENLEDEDAWLIWSIRAIQSIYGYEFQGDNLLLARENVLYTFIENMIYKFGHEPSLIQLKKVANIVAWNLWQMDGITYTIPYGMERDEEHQMSIFEFLVPNDEADIASIPQSTDIPYSKIRDWRAEETMEYITLIKGEK